MDTANAYDTHNKSYPPELLMAPGSSALDLPVCRKYRTQDAYHPNAILLESLGGPCLSLESTCRFLSMIPRTLNSDNTMK